MDPQQTAVYAKAHGDLQDLFREIARHGRVTAHELQHALLPLTAGDAKRDLQELIDDMKHKQTSLDEPDFIRVMWKKMYLTNVVYTTQHTAHRARPSSAGSGAAAARRGEQSSSGDQDDPAINIPLAHVIVSIKRRSQLKQFANYYASRGISGADHLNADKNNNANESRTPRHLVVAQKKRQAAAAAAAQTASITALRERTSSSYDIVVCCYDTNALCMKVHVMYKGVEKAVVSNCSRLYCLVSSKETGMLFASSRHFVDQVRARAAQLYADSHCLVQDTDRALSSDEDGDDYRPPSLKPQSFKGLAPGQGSKDLYLTKLDDMGLRNIISLGVGRGKVVATTERRVHCWHAFEARRASPEDAPPISDTSPVPKMPSPEKKSVKPRVPIEQIEFLEDEGDCFGHVPLLKRAKIVSDVPGIRQLACGDRFVVGLAGASELYVWGTAPLGRGKSTPARLPFFVPPEPSSTIAISRVACGHQHVLALSSHGSVFAWGSNVQGQLGLSELGSALDDAVDEPTEIALSSVALDIACGDHHSVVLTDKGGLLAWGNNWDGQLGLDPTATETGCVYAPTKVNWWLRRESNMKTHHGPVGDDDGVDDVGDANGSPTRGSPFPPQKPSTPRPPRVYLLTAIGDTTAIVTEQGQVFVWGKCVPPGRFAGACGVVSKWRAQHLHAFDELLAADNKGYADDSAAAATATRPPVASPWASLAIADGLVLLTQHAAAAAPPAKESLAAQSHTSQQKH